MKAISKITAQLALMGVLVSLLVAWPEAAEAKTVPATLADRRPVQTGPVEPGFPIGYLGVLWDTPDGHDQGEEAVGTEPHGAVRFRHEGAWGPWHRLIEDGIEGEGQWASGLLPGGGAEAFQVRGVPAQAVDPQAVAINTTDGPMMRLGEQPGGSAHAVDNDMCRSRADWGADESLRFDGDGNEVWPTELHDVQVMTVHHTATTNDDPDPAATVRAIYRYHAVDQGWGDIGYQYLIDESGVVYEGRWSGTESASCATASGDGSDFAHEHGTDRMVTGAHTGGWNSGNLGTALLGEFTDHRRFGGDPKPEAVDALEDLLAELALRHNLDPLARVNYVNPVSGEERTVDVISGHRDYTSTECPGERLYDRLPAVRQDVATKMSGPGDSPPAVAVTSPAPGATVSGTTAVTADASDDVAVVHVSFSVDGATIGTDADGADGWSAAWDTTAVDDGDHTVTAVATDSAQQSSSHSVVVTVANGGTQTDTTVHISDLDGTAQSQKGQWGAVVTITVADPVADATINGTWTTTGTAASCTTSTDGRCSMSSPLVAKNTESISFTVTDVAHAMLTYQPAANTDPDGDSDGTTITITRASQA